MNFAGRQHLKRSQFDELNFEDTKQIALRNRFQRITAINNTLTGIKVSLQIADSKIAC